MKDEDNKPGLKVLEFKKPEPKETEDDLGPDTILNGAMDRLESVIVAGWSKDGSFYLATSLGAISENLMILEASKSIVLDYLMDRVDLDSEG